MEHLYLKAHQKLPIKQAQGGAEVLEIVLSESVSINKAQTGEKFEANFTKLISDWDNRTGGQGSIEGDDDGLTGGEDKEEDAREDG